MSGHFISSTTSDPFGSTPSSKVKIPRPPILKPRSASSSGSASPTVAKEPSADEGSAGKMVVCPFCYTRIKGKKGMPCPNEECYSHRRGIPLPDEVFTHDLFSVAIVGASSSGKSHYLAALKHSLVNESFWGDGDIRGGYWNWSFVTYYNPDNADNQSVDNPYIRYEDNLYSRKVTLESTKRDDEHPPLLLSLEYLHPIRRMFDEPRFRKKGLLVAITDTAGEHSHSESIGALEDNYPVLKKLIKGVIVMLDPKELDSSGAANAVLSWFKRKRGKAKLPIALCLSKIDELSRGEESFPAELLDAKNFNTNLSVPGRLALPNVEQISLAVRRWMSGNAMHSTAQNIESSFRYHAFFASSALGIEPFKLNADGSPQFDGSGAMMLRGEPKPLRVLDPLLWILWQHGKLGGAERLASRMNGGVS